jgi:hypothetical protein
MRYLITALLIVAFHAPCFAWDSPCYKGSLTSMPFPRENTAIITLEAKRVVSVQGNLMVYDLGTEKIVIKTEGDSCLAFLDNVKKSRCTAKGLVSLVIEKKNFAGTVTYRVTPPTPAASRR